MEGLTLKGEVCMLKRNKKIPLSSKAKRRIIIRILLIIFAVIIGERIYNSRDEFQTEALDAEDYGILDAGFTSSEKIREFKFICQLLEENYPFFKVNERVNGIDWFENIGKYKRILRNTKGDGEYFVALNNILKDLNDRNTFILTGDEYRLYYKYYFPDKREILHYERSLGRYMFDGQLDNIEVDPKKHPLFYEGPVLETKVLVEDEIAYMRILAMSNYRIEEDYEKIKSFLKEVEDYDKLIVDIRGNAGGSDEYWQRIVELLIDEGHSAEYYSFFKQKAKTAQDPFLVSGLTTIEFLDDKILASFPEEVRTDFKYYKLNRIKIDPKEDVNFKGKIYLLVDEEVYGSAEKFAAFAKDTGFATLVGKNTGGGMTFEEVPIQNMPYGGFIISYSRELVLNSDGTINMETGTSPHILVDNTTYNKNMEKDKCIQAAIED